jgi:hypothetical protein
VVYLSALAVLSGVASGDPVGCGIGAPLGIGGCGPGPIGCGIGAPFGFGGFGFECPLTSIVGLGLAMIDSVIGAAFSCIPLGGPGFGGFGIGGCGIPFGGFC